MTSCVPRRIVVVDRMHDVHLVLCYMYPPTFKPSRKSPPQGPLFNVLHFGAHFHEPCSESCANSFINSSPEGKSRSLTSGQLTAVFLNIRVFYIMSNWENSIYLPLAYFFSLSCLSNSPTESTTEHRFATVGSQSKTNAGQEPTQPVKLLRTKQRRDIWR